MANTDNPFAPPSTAKARRVWPLFIGGTSAFFGLTLGGCYTLGAPFLLFSRGPFAEIILALLCVVGAILALPAGIATLLRLKIGRWLHLAYAVLALASEGSSMAIWIYNGNNAAYAAATSLPAMVWPAICLLVFALYDPSDPNQAAADA